LKLFKPPDHPDLAGQPHEQHAARERIKTHQEKLRVFPKNLPAHVITPEELVTDSSGQRILGYTMQLLSGVEVLLRYADKTFRQAGIGNDSVSAIFRDLHATVAGTHTAGVVIGDFNDLNVLVKGKEAFLIDADSFSFGKFPCRVFTARFVDPLLCDPKATAPALIRSHTAVSDWYAFAVMLMQCLLFVDPYGGVYVPKDPAKRIPHGARPLKRITVFHPEVRYPKPAVHYRVLPDSLLHYFQQLFEKDERGEFPYRLLEELHWTKCANCGTEHARNSCPNCQTAAPGAVKEVTTKRGQVTVSRIFRTSGRIIFATLQGGKLRYLYHENGQFKREDERTILSGPVSPTMRFRIQKDRTLIGMNGTVLTLEPDSSTDRMSVDSYGTLPIFDANESSRYWVQNGSLWSDGKVLGGIQMGPNLIGNVLSNQTLFWVGPTFGFGFYRAGSLSVSFVFDTGGRSINDSVMLPPIRGQLVDSTCVFTGSRCWFFVTTREGGKTKNQCFVILRNGQVETTAEAEENDGSWLGTIRGKCATGEKLFAPTDHGIVRVSVDNGRIGNLTVFQDTEPFVDSATNLFLGENGLYAVTGKEVRLIRIN
jgi:H/ACA ribonucleoprotein complex subunit 3